MKRRPSPRYPEGWSVPVADHYLAFEKTTKYCTVIPVINEGEKILRQLRTMTELGMLQRADTILADGGSTDGSMEHGFLERVGVRALLVKRDRGKLGAQLRMAYAFALREGYEGIVTIDGNCKDSEESIPLFMEALQRGVDYAQASRFIPGGKGVNTPLVRSLAIKFIHAPLVSLAARKRLTDTTQGFRAYSRRYLLHPRVQPFREVFMTYELLAYLSVKASRLGLNVEEIPTTRTYPDSGAVPTKISFLRGNWELMRILFGVLRGAYDPVT